MTGAGYRAVGDGRPMASRSLLSVPASNPRMIAKALASEADAVLLDLEDAVAPESKVEARRNAVRCLQGLDRGGKTVLCRVNALDTPYFYRDLLEIVEEAGHALDAVLVPKVNRPEDVYVVATLLSQLEASSDIHKGTVRVEVQIESAAGLINADGIARADSRLGALHFGPGDYAASLGMPQTSIGTMDEWDRVYPGHRLHYPMHRTLVAARAAGIRAMDGPLADYRDEKGLRESCLVARSLGFDGKWCIHPSQIATVNEVFAPTREETAWARRVIEAYEKANAAGSGAVSVEGQMVDAASIRVARRVLDLARR